MTIPQLQNVSTMYRSEKYIRVHYPEFYVYLSNNYRDIENFSERLYLYSKELTEQPKCVCGNNLPFLNFSKGYRQYCSCGCAGKHNRDKMKQTCLERYGVENGSQIDFAKEKYRQTCLEKYGVENVSQSYDVKAKTKQTNLERYGVGCTLSNPKIAEKSKATCREHFGTDYPMQSNNVKEKSKATCLEKYGVENIQQVKEIRDRTLQTFTKRYGFVYALQDPEFQEKMKRACFEKYGTENPAQSQEIQEKIKQTNIDRYGGTGFASKELSDKIYQTNLERYGSTIYNKSESYNDRGGEILNQIKQTNIDRYGVDYYSQTEEYKEKSYLTKKKNHTFNSSSIEQEFKSWLDENNINYKYQYKSKEYPFACDFYFPDQDIYLEINGMWTHGPHPFDPDSEEDRNLLNYWISKVDTNPFYKTAIGVWTKSDPKKVQTAKDNNIKLYSIYSNKIDEVINFYQNIIIL